MTDELRQLAERVRIDLVELQHVIKRIDESWNLGSRSSDDYHIDSVALNLHGFYTGLERIFERIVSTVDGFKPKGENWHKALLRQVSNEVPDVRPCVISQETQERLEEYLGFRHVVRNVYVFKFDPAKVESLVKKCAPLFSRTREELLSFAKFLEEQVGT